MMKPSTKIKFMQSAAYFKELPIIGGSEYAVLGRSNVGKSTFINHALAAGALARVSKRPGKTTLANLYDLGGGLYFTDLPGYGFAKASFAERDRWGKLINDYFCKRENLRGALWLLDIRHPGTGADMEAAEWLAELKIPVLPILTKGDKLSKSQRKKHAAEFMDVFGFAEEPVIYSALEHESRAFFWTRFNAWREKLRDTKIITEDSAEKNITMKNIDAKKNIDEKIALKKNIDKKIMKENIATKKNINKNFAKEKITNKEFAKEKIIAKKIIKKKFTTAPPRTTS